MADEAWIVAWSAPAIAAGKQLAIAAIAAGIGARFRQNLVTLNERLGLDPVGFGEVYSSKGNVV